MLRESYREELDDINACLVEMSNSVGSAMSTATTALLDADVALADLVIAGDERIDAVRESIEERCFTLLARQQPVATDLRTTLRSVDFALASLPENLPQISASLLAASDNAASAFQSLRSVVEGARAPVQSFAGDTLPQINRLSQDIRGLVQNMDELVSTLRRNPGQLLSGPRSPEFRR